MQKPKLAVLQSLTGSIQSRSTVYLLDMSLILIRANQTSLPHHQSYAILTYSFLAYGIILYTGEASFTQN